MNREQAKELLTRYHLGELTTAERNKLEDWYDKLAENEKWEWEPNEKERIRKQMKDAINAQTELKRNNIAGHSFLWKAACILLISSLAFFAYNYKDKIRDTFNPVEYTITAVGAGKHIKLTLSDGSIVLLNSGSRLKYPKIFNRSTREVNLLEGEAFFDIHHEGSRPFLVEAKGSKTNVLGTAFNIRSYYFMENIQITVSRGKVAVKSISYSGNEAKQTVLLPEQQAVISRTSGSIVKNQTNSSDVTGWIKGKYKFNNEYLSNLIGTLENIYQVKITLADKNLNNIRLTSEFERKENLEDILFAVCRSSNLSYVFHNKNILLKRK